MRVVIAVFDGVGMLDVTGPAEVFHAATKLLGSRKRGYEVQLAGPSPGPVRGGNGLRIVADIGFADVGAADTVIVPGGLEITHGQLKPIVRTDIVDWISAGAPHWNRIASVCAGAHMLAAAGLLDGCRATTHWFSTGQLAADHPEIDVDPDSIFVRSGKVWTSAGVTSGMDLALALVAEDHSEKLARKVAQWLVMYLRRPGGQSQFSVPLSTAEPRSRKIRDLRHWLTENLSADLSVPALARRANLSERHFARLFTEQTQVTPAAFVEASRTEAARRLLEQTDEPVDVVAARCGFGSAETLYRTFRRRLGTTPSAYRHRFRF